MKKQFEKYFSLRDEVLVSITEQMHDEGFKTFDVLSEGVLEIVNMVSDYKEEGQTLFPEVIIVNDLDFFKSISAKEIIIAHKPLTVSEFTNVIKLCAPLAVGNWVVFIEVKDEGMKYGIVNAELVETSPTIYEQTVGSLRVELEGISILYIRNIGSKTVELTGFKKKLLASLTLNKSNITADHEIDKICEILSKDCSQDVKTIISLYFKKTINEAIRRGHGNLIGVVSGEETNDLTKLKTKLKDGEYLDEPLDLGDYVLFNEQDKTNGSSVTLAAHQEVVFSMLNHDGITLINTRGMVLGYHIFIETIAKDGIEPIGGARSRAFESMINSELFEACFYKSQDGNSKIWIK